MLYRSEKEWGRENAKRGTPKKRIWVFRFPSSFGCEKRRKYLPHLEPGRVPEQPHELEPVDQLAQDAVAVVRLFCFLDFGVGVLF